MSQGFIGATGAARQRTRASSSMMTEVTHEGGLGGRQTESDPPVEFVAVDLAGCAQRYVLPRSLAISMARELRASGGTIGWYVDAPGQEPVLSTRRRD